MKQLQALLRATTNHDLSALQEAAFEELRDIFPESVWGIKYDAVQYDDKNRKSLWDYGVPKAAQRLLESAGGSQESYGRWLGDIHFHAISIYIKSFFGEYRDNTGWRISIFSVPRAGAAIAGIASHYQNAQAHNKLAVASALLRTAAEAAIAQRQSPGVSLSGRAVTGDDWDGFDLMSTPILSVDGHDISSVMAQGLNIKCARTTTVKKIISSFITLIPHFEALAPADAATDLDKLREASLFLVKEVYPFTNLEEFESFRTTAYNDPSSAGLRLRMKSGSAINSVVRVYVGPPGTGKTLTAVRDAVHLVEPTFTGDFTSSFERFNELHHACCFLTFHPSLQYHDLVESIRPVLMTKQAQEVVDSEGEVVAINDEDENKNGPSSESATKLSSLSYAVFEGPLLRMIRRAQADPKNNYVVVIDEINRGDLSRILGPLISCLETDKRAGAQFPIGYELQYPKDEEHDGRLYLPSNLHILGTMNSTDRNVALVDYALRRRFDFVDVLPEPSLLALTEDEEPIDCSRLLDVLNQRVSYLLDEHHRLGHGFFMGCKTNREVFERLAKKVVPQLREYFFGNEGMLLLVFGEAKTSPYSVFRSISTNSFEDTFGISREVASSHGYRGTTVSSRLQLDPRFWNESATNPGPGDANYATRAVTKIYRPMLLGNAELPIA